MAKGKPFKVKLNKDSKNSRVALIEPLDGTDGLHWIWNETQNRAYRFKSKKSVETFFKRKYPKHEILDSE